MANLKVCSEGRYYEQGQRSSIFPARHRDSEATLDTVGETGTDLGVEGDSLLFTWRFFTRLRHVEAQHISFLEFKKISYIELETRF